jgi:hypothetical protein
VICIFLHAPPPRRISEIRAELILVGKYAAATADALRQLSTAISKSVLQDALFEALPGVAELIAPSALDHLRALAGIAEHFGERWRGKDRGGPTKMYAFDSLVRLLADAFARATGHRASLTYDAHQDKYTGKFWDLVETVLPKVGAIAEQGGRSLAQPSNRGARGTFIQRVLVSMDKTPSATT